MLQPKLQDCRMVILYEVIGINASTCCVETQILLLKGKDLGPSLAQQHVHQRKSRMLKICQYQAGLWFENLGANP